MQELLTLNYKWPYSEFWFLIDVMNKNTYHSYWKLPFWNNVISAIYLQVLENLKKGTHQQFAKLSSDIIKKCDKLIGDLPNSEDLKAIKKIDIMEDDYDFDGL